jgi:hypothetical protein
MLQRAGLRDTLFIAMSNYYYEEKVAYLETLGKTRAGGHDLTPFLIFGLKGIALQCNRLFGEIRTNVKKEIFRNLMHDLFNRLQTPKKRVIADRQIRILEIFLRHDRLEWIDLRREAADIHSDLKNPIKALVRDLNYLIDLEAIRMWWDKEDDKHYIAVDLDWPEKITEITFFQITRNYPKVKSRSFLP